MHRRGMPTSRERRRDVCSAGLLNRRRCPPAAAALTAAPALCRQRAALTCKRFAALACSPHLLREVKIKYAFPPELHSLLAWLVRHGRHVCNLALKDVLEGEPESTIDGALAACLGAVGAAGQLEELSLDGYKLHTEWLPALRSLRHLRLDGYPLHISAAIGGLPALGSLELRSNDVCFAAGARLPPTITRLHVEAGNDEEMPEQVSGKWLLAAVDAKYLSEWCVAVSAALPSLRCPCFAVDGAAAAAASAAVQLCLHS